VQRYVGTQLLHDPLRHRLNLGLGVVLARYEQCREFEPDIGFVFQVKQRVEYRLQMPAADFPIEAISERFQIDVRRVHEVEELIARSLGDIAGGDGNVLDILLATSLGDVHGVLKKDHGIVVGIRDAATACFDSGIGNSLRHRTHLQPIELTRLRDIPVLTELAGKIAAGRAE